MPHKVWQSRLSVVSGPSGDILSVADDVKPHLRVETADEDDLIQMYLDAAIDAIDPPKGSLGRSLLTRTLRLTLDVATDARPPDMVRLPAPPVASITSVTYRKDDDTFGTMSTDDYLYDLSAHPAIWWTTNSKWPTDIKLGTDCVRIDYVAGSAAADIPAGIKAWLLLTTAELYRDRELTSLGVSFERLPYRHLIEGHRVRTVLS